MTERVIMVRMICNVNKESNGNISIFDFIFVLTKRTPEVCLTLFFYRKRARKDKNKVLFSCLWPNPKVLSLNCRSFIQLSHAVMFFSTHFFQRTGSNSLVSSYRHTRALLWPHYPKERDIVILLFSLGAAPGCTGAMLHPNSVPHAVGPNQRPLKRHKGKKLNTWSNWQDAKVKLWVMPSEVDSRWHPWITQGLLRVSGSQAGQCLKLGFSFVSWKSREMGYFNCMQGHLCVLGLFPTRYSGYSHHILLA